MEERKVGGGKRMGRDCAALKVPLKSPGSGQSLTLRHIDALPMSHNCRSPELSFSALLGAF